MKTQNSPTTHTQSTKEKPQRVRRTIILASVFLAIVILAVMFAYNLSTSSTGNYAKDIAKPLEQALLSNGAVKKCETGDDGRGMDNREPWYGGYFELPADRSKAIELINKIASDNGYKLAHASPENRGHLGAVADIYIDSWYFDNTSKKHSFTDLQDNKVELAMTVNAHGANKACGSDASITVDAEHSVITVDVELSNFK